MMIRKPGMKNIQIFKYEYENLGQNLSKIFMGDKFSSLSTPKLILKIQQIQIALFGANNNTLSLLLNDDFHIRI